MVEDFGVEGWSATGRIWLVSVNTLDQLEALPYLPPEAPQKPIYPHHLNTRPSGVDLPGKRG